MDQKHFIEILPLKKANAKSICSALVEYCREKNSVGKAYRNGIWWSCYSFSGDKGVQRRLKELLPHALFVHCRCHVLQLASVQAANATPGSSMSTLPWWCYGSSFITPPKREKSLKEIQKVLDLPELKILKLSDIFWLPHERCVKAVKASYSSIVLLLKIYKKHHMN